MAVDLGFLGGAGWVADYAVPRRWLPPSRSRAGRWGAGGAGSGGDRAAAGGLGGWLVVVGEQERREAVVHVPGDVVRQHPQEHMRADPLFGVVADGPDVQVGIEGAEGPLHLGERLAGG